MPGMTDERAGESDPLQPSPDGEVERRQSAPNPIKKLMDKLPPEGSPARMVILVLVCLFLAYVVMACGYGSVIGFYYVKAEIVNPGPPHACYVKPTLEGYPDIEERFVTTADGLKLAMWRLPQNESTAAVAVRPVLLMHGLEASSRDWFDGLNAQALPYMLWRAGFDVWMGNNRGNFLSNRDCVVWNWTVIEMADYDLPRMIEEVLNTTGAEKLSYVGHSQGTLQAFLHFSQTPETARRILHFAALSPPVFMTMRSPTWKMFGGITDTSGGPWWKFQRIYQDNFAVYEEIFQDQCRVLSFVGACNLYCGTNMGGSFMEGTKGYAPSCGDKFQCISAGTSAENMRYLPRRCG